MINAYGIQMRWITHACYEIIMPNGKHLLFDPFITDAVPSEEFDIASLERVDYVCITHTHFDHLLDLPYIVERFHPIVVVGAEAAADICRMLGGNGDDLFPVDTGDVLHFEDLTISVTRAKHTRLTFVNPWNYSTMLKRSEGKLVPMLTDDLGTQGSLEALDYFITFENGMRLLFASGFFGFMNSQKIAEKNSPDIVIRQISNEMEPEEFGELLAKYHAQLILPFHHEGTCANLDYGIDEYMRRAEGRMRQLYPYGTFYSPPRFRWFRLRLGIEVVD